VGSNVAKFIERLTETDYVVTVGTPVYLKKYLNEDPHTGTGVAAEMGLINNIMMGTEEQAKDSADLARGD